MSQEQISRSTGKNDEVVETEAKNVQNSDLTADVEDILGEIDEVLETNAAEFVQNYVQKGGQ